MLKILKLSFLLARINFKLKNEGSYLGVFWYLLSPLLMFLLLFFVFNDRLGGSIPLYPLYLFAGIILFNFFLQTTSESVEAIIKNSSLIKSINFSSESLVGSILFKNLFSHVIEIIIFSLFLFYFGVSPIRLIFYPLVFLLLFIFSLGFSLLLASLTVYFVDLVNIWAFSSRLLFFLTPIFYATQGQKRLLLINLMNPMYYYLSLAREMVIYGNVPSFGIFAGAVFFSIFFIMIGFFVFKQLKIKFAEMV